MEEESEFTVTNLDHMYAKKVLGVLTPIFFIDWMTFKNNDIVGPHTCSNSSKAVNTSTCILVVTPFRFFLFDRGNKNNNQKERKKIANLSFSEDFRSIYCSPAHSEIIEFAFIVGKTIKELRMCDEFTKMQKALQPVILAVSSCKALTKKHCCFFEGVDTYLQGFRVPEPTICEAMLSSALAQWDYLLKNRADDETDTGRLLKVQMCDQIIVNCMYNLSYYELLDAPNNHITTLANLKSTALLKTLAHVPATVCDTLDVRTTLSKSGFEALNALLQQSSLRLLFLESTHKASKEDVEALATAVGQSELVGFSFKGCAGLGEHVGLILDSIAKTHDKKPKLLRLISIIDCGMSKRFAGLLRDYRDHACLRDLRVLELSGFKAGKNGTENLCEFLRNANMLRELYLPDSGIDLESLCLSLTKALGNQQIAVLNISGNKLSYNAAVVLSTFIQNAHSLLRLMMAGCLLHLTENDRVKAFSVIIDGAASKRNHIGQQLQLDFTNNDLGVKAIASIQNLVNQCTSRGDDEIPLNYLNFSDNSLGEEGILMLLNALQGKGIKSLLLRRSVKSKSFKKKKELGFQFALAQFVANTPCIKKLNVDGWEEKMLTHLIVSLKGMGRVEHLSLQHTNLSDGTFLLLFDLLKNNKTLRFIDIRKNKMSVEMFNRFAYAITGLESLATSGDDLKYTGNDTILSFHVDDEKDFDPIVVGAVETRLEENLKAVFDDICDRNQRAIWGRQRYKQGSDGFLRPSHTFVDHSRSIISVSEARVSGFLKPKPKNLLTGRFGDAEWSTDEHRLEHLGDNESSVPEECISVLRCFSDLYESYRTQFQIRKRFIMRAIRIRSSDRVREGVDASRDSTTSINFDDYQNIDSRASLITTERRPTRTVTTPIMSLRTSRV